VSTTGPEVRTWVDGHLGRIELNRPDSLNALTDTMLVVIRTALNEWANDSRIEAVAVTGAGARAFCAGGDIISIHTDAVSGMPPRGSKSARFWDDEYALNLDISRYPKPYIPIMGGIVLGGGVGISAHGSHRVVTDNTVIGMPETGIGFIPDVGGTWLLSHAPGELGTHLALTAGSVGPADAIHAGLADTYIPEKDVNRFLQLLAKADVESALLECAADPPPGRLEGDAEWIDACYHHDDAATIVAALRASTNERAHNAADKIERNSPTAVTVTLRALREARDLPDLADALSLEFTLACNFLANPDFAEGIRAAVIDKDRSPRWQPPNLSEVEAEAVARYFNPQGSEQSHTTPQGANT
jgi:enoyl-CoA hydratase